MTDAKIFTTSLEFMLIDNWQRMRVKATVLTVMITSLMGDQNNWGEISEAVHDWAVAAAAAAGLFKGLFAKRRQGPDVVIGRLSAL